MVRQCDATGTFLFPGPFITRITHTAERSVFVQVRYSNMLLERTSPYSIWKCHRLNVIYIPPGAGIRVRSAVLWAMAAKCRGVSDRIISVCSRMPDPPNATKAELHQLVLQADTDYTWRFWHDLFFAYRYFCIPTTIAQVLGIALTASAVVLGAQYLRS